MEPKTRLAEIFQEIGIHVRPTDDTLASWNMTLHRFNQIVQNNSRTDMTVGEMNNLKKWLQKHFKGKHAYLYEHDLPSEYRQTKLPLHQ